MTAPARSLALLGTLAAAVACSGCTGWQSALDPHGVQADGLVRLLGAFVAICTLVWMFVATVLLRALWRRRRQQADGIGVDESTEKRMRTTITLAVAATLFIVVVLTAISFVTTRRITAPDPNAMVIRVRGWQWWWEVTYPGESPDRTLVTANEIHVPVGRTVRIELAAADVIHSFWVPNLAGKVDMIPGRDTTLTFRATRAGTYRGQCAEFCGLQHAHMAFIVIADAPADFDAWRDAQLAAAIAPAKALAQAGHEVFLAKACASCHTVRGTDAAGTLGPDLTHVGSRSTIAAGLFETTRGSLAAWIADPQRLKPGNNMPMVDLSADELNAVAAYLEGLR
ncbi:MAG: cytochrome c oxidase subunit II [Pseudomonadota bacterium]|nr:cytochrome c oxidase subunit II [Pseudomonadota bacterium]